MTANGGGPRRARSANCPVVHKLCEPIVTSRLLVVAAHPDDETIGAGGLLARSVDAHVAVITDGAPREPSMWAVGVKATTRGEYARVRREELRLALADAGLASDRVHLLEAPDGEAIENVPAIVERLVELIGEIDPEIVLTHAYEGGHVDHDATALAVHAAMFLAKRGHPHEMALYHGDRGAVAVHEFLPGGPAACTIHLDERLRTRKSKMIGRYESQRQYEAYFGIEVERYRCAPRYDFRESPDPIHRLLYERNNVVTGEHWRARAQVAIEQLKLVDWLQERAAQPTAGQLRQCERTDVTSGAQRDTALVSVVVRTVGRDTLTHALDSIASQTYSNIEIVLVDVTGHGPPASWNDREGLVLRLCPGSGFGRPMAANAGINAATGDYIMFLDDDDWFHPHHIESLVTALRAAPNARVAYSEVEIIELSDDGLPRRRWVFDAPYDPVALLCENYIPLNAVLVERGLLDQGHRFDETLPIYEDWDFLIGLSRRTTFAKAPGIGAVYRWPPGSGVNDPQRSAAAQERVFTKWRTSLSQSEHVALMRRAIEQTELNDGRTAQLRALQTHLKAQDEELERLRPFLGAQEQRLEQFRIHLKAQDEELERLRPCVATQEAQLQELRTHLERQNQELDRLQRIGPGQDLELRHARQRLQLQDEELAALRTRVAALGEDVRRLNESRAVVEEGLAAITGSRSWRLTRPLRALRSLIPSTTIQSRSTGKR